MFAKILHASDGSEHAFHGLSLALDLAQRYRSELHIVCVEELPYVADLIGEVREVTEAAATRYEAVLKRARAMADESGVTLHTHVLTGHPVRDVIELAAELKADLLVIGARGHTELYERLIGSRADRLVQLAQCPVLVAK